MGADEYEMAANAARLKRDKENPLLEFQASPDFAAAFLSVGSSVHEEIRKRS